MADTILGGDFTVRYLDDNRCKFVYWTGTATGTRTANELYSAMATLLDEPATGDDATFMTAETPVEYTVGLIDANDADPWYIQYEAMQHVTGGAVRTAGWTRTEGSATGIVIVPVTSNTITSASIGFDITYATDNDSGTLLEVIEQGATDYLVIRPDTNAAANSFDNTPTVGGVLTCNAQTATLAAASTTGEQIWANLYNVTAIDTDTHVYMYQGTVDDATRARIADINVSGQDWWPEGAFDRCIFIRDYQTSGNPVIDSGYITVFARKGNTLYDSFEVLTSTTSGGRNPVPLKASADANHTTGYKSILLGGDSGNFSVGDEIQGDTSGARGIITLITGTTPTRTLHYYLIGDPQTDFNGTEAITNNDDTGAATSSGAPANQGPALAGWFTSGVIPTIAHGNTTFDIDDDGTAEGYGINIDCNANPLTEVYEFLQHTSRNGETGTTNTDGIEGEQYVGATVYLEYSGTVSGGTIAEGEDVLQATSLATGVVISHDTTLKQILLRDTRGTFDTTNTVTSQDAGAGTITPDTAATAFNAFTDAPFGRLAGGRFFGARGVLISDYLAADENAFQLIDSQGNERTRPIAITLSISNLRGTAITDGTADYAVMHRLTGSGGSIDKTEYSSTGGTALAATTQVVDTAITADTPGKTTGAVLNIRDASDDNQHYRIRFGSWNTSTFTLASFNLVGGATAGTNTTTIVYATGGFNAAIRRGDLVWNTTRSAFSYVVTVDSDTQVTISPAIASQTSTDAVDFNVMPIDDDTLDDVYVSLIDEYPTAATASVSIVYLAPVFFRAKVSNTRHTTKIRRFVTDDTTSGTNRNVATVRNTDTIHA